MKQIIILMLCICNSVLATTHYVDLNSPSPTPPYTSWATAANEIQHAVDVATSNDVVMVADGHYYLASTITVNNHITIESVNEPQGAIVDGGGITSCFSLNGDYQILLTGFTITNGYAAFNGGGVYCSGDTPVVSNCTISGNTAVASGYPRAYGGGMYGGTANNCTISGNTASSNREAYGGGMYGGTAYDCIISGNFISAGAGIGTHESTLYNCTVSNNYGFGHGGGMYGGTADNCIISGNVCLPYSTIAYNGGGAYNASLSSCLIADNEAFLGGGLFDGDAYTCTFIDNIAVSSGDTCNSGYHSATIYNSIIAYIHKTPTDSAFVLRTTQSDLVSVYYSCSLYLEDDLYGRIQVEPRFIDATNGNYRLASDSPCINQGVDPLPHTDTDLDGLPRIVNGTVDMGAYEYQGADYLVDDDNDGLSNVEELRHGTDPNNPDSDGDGFGDGVEVASGLDPLNPDDWIPDYITANSETFDLYPSNVVLDVAVGQMLLETISGEARLYLQLEQSEDLQTWTNAGDYVEWILPVDTNKQFFRVRSEP